MQSTMDTWQYENLSSATELSPPVSPDPNSLENTTLSLNNASSYVKNSSPKATLTSIHAGGMGLPIPRTQMASNLLSNLEQPYFPELMDQHSDFGTNWNEQSFNLTLFDELSEVEYTPPASPDESLSPPPTTFSSPKRPQTLALSSTGTVKMGQSSNEKMGTPEFDQLTSEFQSILESLKKSDHQNSAIGGIPATFIAAEEEEIVMASHQSPTMELELPLVAGNEVSLSGFELNASNQDADDIAMIFNEDELLSADVQSSLMEPAALASNIVDIEAEAAERIVDALLEGNLKVAESYVEVNAIANGNALELILEEAIEKQEEDDDDDCSIISSTYSQSSSMVSSVCETPPNEPEVKKERRGRKPSQKSPYSHIKNKALRKKEQNKTAATRYRQKKKIEAALIATKIEELEKINKDLRSEEDDLKRQVKMVKQLLREILCKKPNRAAAASSISKLGSNCSSIRGTGMPMKSRRK